MVSNRPPPESCGSLPSQLQKPLQILVFDWDGTAVVDRQEDAASTRELLERLLELDVVLVVVTGTNFGNIDRQFPSYLRGPKKRRLFVLTNRGSEAFGFDPVGQPVLLHRREATAEEHRLLTEVAESVRDELARSGLEVRIVYDRLNRRKIDLLPLPEWSDPPKSRIGELNEKVRERLRNAGIEGGLEAVIRLAEQKAREKGLIEARITSDIKHVEVGLTDKSDSIRWVLKEVALPRAVPQEEILIAGDEFGPLSGFPGSDSKMMVPEARGAVVVSVGPEPAGVPPGVLSLGGGPARFRELLACQADLHERRAWGDLPARRTRDSRWLLVEEGWAPGREQEIESLFALANGYSGTRGSLEEGGIYSTPATFLAGVFDAGPESSSVPELAAAPNWTEVHLRNEHGRIDLANGTTLEHRRVLDLRQGILWRDWLHRDSAGRETRIRTLRFTSLADRHVFVQSVAVTPMNYSGRLDLSALLQVPGETRQAVKLVPESVTNRQRSDREVVRICELRSSRSDLRVTFATAGLLRPEDAPLIPAPLGEPGAAALESWNLDLQRGRTTRFDRLCAVYSSRDAARPTDEAVRLLDRLLAEGTASALQAHVDAWASHWHGAAIDLPDDAQAERALRFGVFHLTGTAHPEDDRVSVGARALTGDAYKGHVFWETEIYVLPFHNLTNPAAARSLLLYRHHTLPAARKRARQLGYAGALYAWESAVSGEDTTPDVALTPTGEVVAIWTGRREHHISADIAYAVDQYFRATGDEEFLIQYGGEMVLETARFWTSRGIWGQDGHYHIEHVIGPDEYHEDVADNAYTNLMAQRNLEQARDLAFWMKERHPGPWARLTERIGLGPEEPERWGEIARAMTTGFNPATKLYEQFRGYFQLEDLDLNAFADRRLPMDLLLGKERIERSQIVKQADVVMAVYLLWDRMAPDVREANFRYYEPRTGHGSSLSPPIHAAVAARLGETEKALRYFHQTCAIDLSESGSYAARGIHIGALGGLWQSAVLGFCGLAVGPEGLSISPHLPSDWRRITFAARWHGRRQEFNLELPRAAREAPEPPVPAEPVLVGPPKAVARISPQEPVHRGGVP